jgi:hypothetical protein
LIGGYFMRNVRLLLTALIVIATSTFNYAQENVLRPKSNVVEEEKSTSAEGLYTIKFGIEAGLNYNMYSQNLEWIPVIPLSVTNVFKKASGISPYFAVSLDFPIDSKFGIQTKFVYDMRSMDNTYTGFRDFLDFTSGNIYDAQVEAKNKITGADISISALLRYNITNELVLTAGPILSIPAGDYTRELTQTSLTDGVYFWDEFGNSSSVLTVSEKIDDVKTRIGIDLGIGYKIPLSTSIILEPNIRLNYFFSNFHGDNYLEDGTRDSLYGTADLFLTDSKLQVLKFGLVLWF